MDLTMVVIDILLTLRNMLLDRRADKKAARELEQRQKQEMELQQKVALLETAGRQTPEEPPKEETV